MIDLDESILIFFSRAKTSVNPFVNQPLLPINEERTQPWTPTGSIVLVFSSLNGTATCLNLIPKWEHLNKR